MKRENLLTLAIAASLGLAGACAAQAGRRAAPAGAAAAAAQGGLLPLLNNDDKVISEAVARNMTSLQEYLFSKNNVPPEKQDAYKAVIAIRQLNNPDLPPRARAKAIEQVARGIDKVLVAMNSPKDLMQLNKTLVLDGTQRALNILEYWPEGSNPKVQAQLRPIAEAIDRVYAKAIDVGTKEAARLANSITAANQATVGQQWEQTQSLVGLAKFSRGNNLYALALSMDKADPQRRDTAIKGAQIMQEYEDPQYEIPLQAKLAVGKLFLAAGPSSVGQAKSKFEEVIKAPWGKNPAALPAEWGQKFEAMYFTSVADVIDGKLPEAAQDKSNLEKWLAATPPPIADEKQKQETLKGINAAMDMLQYRILWAQAEASETKPADKTKYQADAMTVLGRLAAARPDLAGIISEQMMALLPENPDVAALNPLMLRAMVHRADDELVKPEGQALDSKILNQGVAAARELIRRQGKEGVRDEDVDLAAISLAVFESHLGEDGKAANAYLNYLEQFKDPGRREIAYQGALAAVGRLQRDRKDDPLTQEVYMRFLRVATAKPLEKKEFYLEYGTALVKRNIQAMQAQQLTPEMRGQIKAGADRAIELLGEIPDPRKQLYAKFYQMMAIDQLIDLHPSDAELQQYISLMQRLGAEVQQLASQEEAAGSVPAQTLRLYKVRATMLMANLAEHARGPEARAAKENALKLLGSGFEADVAGLPNAEGLMGEARYLRVKFLMDLGRSQEALDDLGKFVESAGDRSIPVIRDMLDSLNADYKLALENKEVQRADELSAQRAIASRFMTRSVANSKSPEVRKTLPDFEAFQAEADWIAGQREKDPAKRKDFLGSARTVFARIFKDHPDNREVQLKLAVIDFELGNYAEAQKNLAELINENLLGRPKVQQRGSTELAWNDLFWQGRLMLLQSVIKLVEQKAPGFGPEQVEQVKTDLKRLYIQWGEPGGPKWFPEFEKLRTQLMPDWTPPPLEDATPTTHPVTRPVAGK